MIKKYKCPSCNTNMKIGYDETRKCRTHNVSFCGHTEFDEDER